MKSLLEPAARNSGISNLSGNWAEYADDGSPEIQLARAIASIRSKWKEGESVGPIRENLEPVKGLDWKEDSVSYVWKAGDPLSNLLSVLQRRCLEGRMKNLDHPPLDYIYSASLEAVADFVNGDVDFQRISDLILPLSFIHNWNRSGRNSIQRDALFNLPNAYSVMKLTLLPDMFICRELGEDKKIRMEPRMLAMLRADRVKDAYDVAYRRLIASGLYPLFDSPGISNGSEAGRRLAAALLFPLDRRACCTLANRVLQKPKDTNS